MHTAHTRTLQFSILGIAALTLVLLAFADRKALTQTKAPENTEQATEGMPPQGEGSSAGPLLATDLPALPDETLNGYSPLAQALAKAKTKADSLAALQALVTYTRSIKAADYEAYYLAQQALLSAKADEQLAAAKALSMVRLAYASRGTNQTAARKMNTLAAALYTAYLQQQPNDTQAQVGLAVTKVNGETPMEGIQQLRALVQQYPQDKELQYRANLELGKFSLQTKQMDKALQRFEACVQAKPDYFEGYYLKGMAYQMMEKKAEATEMLKKAVSLAPDAGIKQEISQLINAPDADHTH